MDVERKIKHISIEADVNHNFDDIHLTTDSEHYFVQIKDFAGVKLSDIEISNNQVKIKNNTHQLSSHINILFFKEIDIETNCKIFGINALQTDNLFIVSIDRMKIDGITDKLYKANENRERIIKQYFNEILDKRKWTIDLIDLPSIPVFNTKLTEKTVIVGRGILLKENIIFIEGKPGVGKSHLVEELKNKTQSPLVYRFWIGSQDKDYLTRLKYGQFLFNISKLLFHDQKHYDETRILEKLRKSKNTIIIDGLDHVENYNSGELENFIQFIDKAKIYNKIIVLSRPLLFEIKWRKIVLKNWNKGQTKKVLNSLFQIQEHQIVEKIYRITNGYPILVRYIAEHFKKTKELPIINSLQSIDEYYGTVLKNEKGLTSLSLFLCSYSYFFKSEISLLMGEELGSYIIEFVNEHPYLFEIRLNRITLFHDSFNTYLRRRTTNFSRTKQRVNTKVTNSIMSGEIKYLSRLNSFNLPINAETKIFKKYTDINYFEELLSKTIDIEGLRAFYNQLRDNLSDISKDEITLGNIYDFSLIINTINRDHISTSNDFLFTYLTYLDFLGFDEEYITSNGYLFAMLYYIKSGDNSILYNLHSDQHYDTSQFKEKLEDDINNEREFFDRQSKPGSVVQIKKLLNTDFDQYTYERLRFILINLYLHKNINDFQDFTDIITEYVDKSEISAINRLENLFQKKGYSLYQASWILNEAKDNIFALGYIHKNNDYLNLDFEEFVSKYKAQGSFDFHKKILNYIRLVNHRSKKIDISQISSFWSKYYNRKDYSLHSIFNALPIFERLNFINEEQSINLITSIQNQSEKGYRHLLVEYIENKEVTILPFIHSNFNIDSLRIDWFLLSPKFINKLPEQIFNCQLHDTLRQYDYGRSEVEYRDVENVIRSNRAEDLKSMLDLLRYYVRISDREKAGIQRLENAGIKYVTATADKSTRTGSKKRYDQGILADEDRSFIKKLGLKPAEIAKYPNADYTVLAELELYKTYPKKIVRLEIKEILINAITSKSSDGTYFQSLYYFPGNCVKLIHTYCSEVDLKPFFESFQKFIQLASFEIEGKADRQTSSVTINNPVDFY
ncbi:hypothetical protein GCM10007415_34580 [Parapedobacter pyrenivorans]|uniref:NACHT domain-containing protein n=2 Tax=Parapedobacter pyrenivorans TaxID=1305674 RepID=A0A917HYH0_9SPHI|nr:hypothetical protein GCM10007415_34580 [Parapedobacter pyrenivorans]